MVESSIPLWKHVIGWTVGLACLGAQLYLLAEIVVGIFRKFGVTRWRGAVTRAADRSFERLFGLTIPDDFGEWRRK